MNFSDKSRDLYVYIAAIAFIFISSYIFFEVIPSALTKKHWNSSIKSRDMTVVREVPELKGGLKVGVTYQINYRSSKVIVSKNNQYPYVRGVESDFLCTNDKPYICKPLQAVNSGNYLDLY